MLCSLLGATVYLLPDGGQLQLLCGCSPYWQSCVLLLPGSDYRMVPKLGRTGLPEAHL